MTIDDLEAVQAIIDSYKEGYNQAIEDAARLCSKFDEKNNTEVLDVSYLLEIKIKELKK